MRTEQLSKCLEPLQKLRVRLGTSLPVILYYRSFQGDTSVVVLFISWCLFFVLFVPYVFYHIFS